MDIDLLWISGGWFLSSSLSNSSMAAASSKLLPQAVLLLLFLVLVINLSWTQHYRMASASSVSLTTTSSGTGCFTELPSVSRKLLLSSSTHHPLQPTMEFHPKQKINPSFTSPTPSTTAGRNTRAFREAAHEVPSGPNPESNK